MKVTKSIPLELWEVNYLEVYANRNNLAFSQALNLFLAKGITAENERIKKEKEALIDGVKASDTA